MAVDDGGVADLAGNFDKTELARCEGGFACQCGLLSVFWRRILVIYGLQPAFLAGDFYCHFLK